MPTPEGVPLLAELTDLPTYSTQLLDVLESAFPLTNPEPDATLAEIQREAGKQELIAVLRDLRRRGAENGPLCVNKRRITPERKDGDAYLPA